MCPWSACQIGPVKPPGMPTTCSIPASAIAATIASATGTSPGNNSSAFARGSDHAVKGRGTSSQILAQPPLLVVVADDAPVPLVAAAYVLRCADDVADDRLAFVRHDELPVLQIHVVRAGLRGSLPEVLEADVDWAAREASLVVGTHLVDPVDETPASEVLASVLESEDRELSSDVAEVLAVVGHAGELGEFLEVGRELLRRLGLEFDRLVVLGPEHGVLAQRAGGR